MVAFQQFLCSKATRSFVSEIFFSWHMKPVFRSAAVPDMLYMVADVHVEVSCVIIDVTNYDFGDGVVISLDVLNVKFILEHFSYIDGDDGGCQLEARY